MPNKSANEEIHDGILTHTVNLLRVAANQRRRVLSFLEALENRLAGDVQEVVGKSERAVARLGALLKQTRNTIAAAYQGIVEDQQGVLGRVAKAAAKDTARLTNAALRVPLATVGQTDQQLVAIAGKTLINGRYPKEWWGAQSKALQDKFAAQMRLGMVQGEGVDQLVRRVRGTKAANYTDGLMQASKAQAEALVRTSVISVANESRVATILANPELNKALQWVATLDARTTPICRALDGLQWTVPGLEPIGHSKAFPGPTAHWQCRSTQVPVTKSWKELSRNPDLKTEGLQGKYEEILRAKMERAGMKPDAIDQVVAAQKNRFTGEGVPGTLSTTAWLDGKSAAEIDSLLGPGRGALYRAGKITLQDLTDQNNRPLTLAELEKLHSGPPPIPAPAFADMAGAQKYFAEHLGVAAIADGRGWAPAVEDLWGREFGSDAAKVEHATMIAESLRDVYTRFPQMPKTVQAVAVTNTDRARATHDGPTPWLSANPTEWKPGEKSGIAAWEKANGRPWCSYELDKPIRPQVVRHELGHTRSIPAAEALAKAALDRLGVAWAKQNLGEYSASNIMEFMAESFCIFTRPSYVRSSLPADVEAFLQIMVGEK